MQDRRQSLGSKASARRICTLTFYCDFSSGGSRRRIRGLMYPSSVNYQEIQGIRDHLDLTGGSFRWVLHVEISLGNLCRSAAGRHRQLLASEAEGAFSDAQIDDQSNPAARS